MKLLFTILLFLFILPYSIAQGDLRIYQWKDHLPYNGGHTVTHSEDQVFYGTEYSIIAINKKDSSQAVFYSKVDGLSDTGPSWIKFHPRLKVLVVGYQSGNIDLIDADGIHNINDIERNLSIQGNKSISRIYMDDSPLAYLCTQFGMVILNISTGKFVSTVFTPVPVHDFTIFQGIYYMATESGLYTYNPSGGGIVENFANWNRVAISGVGSTYIAKAVTAFKGSLYVGAAGDLYRMEEGDFIFWYGRDGYSIEYLTAEGELLLAGFMCDAECIGKVFYFRPGGFWHENGINCTARPSYAIQDEQGRIWYADRFPQFRLSENQFTPCNYVEFETPYSGNVSEIEVKNGILYLATGGVSESYNYQGSKDGYFTFDRLNWTTYNQFNNPDVAATELENFFRIKPHPTENKWYVGSYWGGLLETDGETYKVYNDTNSSLQGAVGDEARERISGLAFDPQGNLWVSNYLAARPLSVLKNDGTWKSFSFPCSDITNVSQIAVDKRGYKWIMLFSKASGIIVYDDRGTIDDESDDRCIQLGASNSAIPSNSVSSLEVDLDGDVWVGTAEGPVVFDGAGDVFNGHRGSRIPVEQDGVLNYLLGEETVYAIAVDGANRKWFGTGSGVFVQSPSGTEQVAVYNVNNSPLLNNRIVDIAIDGNNGLVYIATNGGLMSFRTDAISGGELHGSQVYSYPNPVRPEYDGPIAIRGLAMDAVVKITDMRGEILFETRALGGQAIWDGLDLKGRKVETGVYLVFSTNDGGGFTKPDALVTKILVVK